MSISNSLAWRLFTYCSLILLTACSSTSKLNVIQHGDPVSFVSQSNKEKYLPFEINNKGILEDAKTGGTAGTLGGAVAGGLLCGPFLFIVCAPLLAATGAVGGGAVGAIVGTATGLTTENKTALTNKATTFIKNNDPQKDLFNEVVKQANKNFTVVAAPGDNEVLIQINSLEFNSFSDGRVAIFLETEVTVNYVKNGKKSHKTKSYQYQSAPEFVETWLGEDDSFYQLRFSDAYRSMAENIVRTL